MFSPLNAGKQSKDFLYVYVLLSNLKTTYCMYFFFSFSVNNQFDPDFKDAGITYEQMQTYIEGILSDCGYYSSLPSARGRTPPLGPILPR